MATETPAAFNQAGTSYGAEQMRRAIQWHIGNVGGVRNPLTDCQVTAPGSGMSVNVQTGECLIPGTVGGSQGTYYGRVSSTTNLVVATANATNPRIDGVFATIDDSQYAGALDDFKTQVVSGTPTAGATLANLNGAPATPASSLLLAYVLVPASSTNVTSGNIQGEQVSPYSTLVFAAASHLVAGGAAFQTSNLTVTEAGLYVVNTAIYCSNAGASAASGDIWLLHNPSGSPPSGTVQDYHVSLAPLGSGGAAATIGGSISVQCAAGDTLGLYYNNTGSQQFTFASGAPSALNSFSATFQHP